MEGIFIPNPVNPPKGDAEKEEEESRLVTTVEEITSAMLRLALELGEKGFLQREFIIYLRWMIKEITGGGQAGTPPGQPMENACPHPEHQQAPDALRPGNDEEAFAGSYREQSRTSGGSGRRGGQSRMQSPTRMGSVQTIPVTAHKLQLPADPPMPINVTVSLKEGTLGRKYPYADLSPQSSRSQGYSDNSYVGRSGVIHPCPHNRLPFNQTSTLNRPNLQLPADLSMPVNVTVSLKEGTLGLKYPYADISPQSSGGQGYSDNSYVGRRGVIHSCPHNFLPVNHTSTPNERSASRRKSNTRRPSPGSAALCTNNSPSCG